MQIIQFAPTADACQIEVPRFKPQPKGKKGEKLPDPVKVARSKAGALHVRPGTTRAVTDDELEILKAAKVKLQVVADSKLAKKSEAKAVEAAEAKKKAAKGGQATPEGASDKGGSKVTSGQGEGSGGTSGGGKGGKGGKP